LAQVHKRNTPLNANEILHRVLVFVTLVSGIRYVDFRGMKAIVPLQFDAACDNLATSGLYMLVFTVTNNW
jgi:hypothetical protein